MPETELKHILYVDDEPDMRMLVQLTLENMGGMKVSLCESGLDALEIAQTGGPQLIILDVLMPDIDGPSVLKEILKNPKTANIPVFFLTGRSAPDAVASYKDMGAKGVLSKPFDLVALPDQVRSLWKECKP